MYLEPEENYVAEGEPLSPPKKTWKKRLSIIAVLSVFFLLVIAIFSFSYFSNLNQNQEVLPTPTPQINPNYSPFPTRKPSSLATDSAVLKVEEKIASVDAELKKIDLVEQVLTFPSIDFKINFEVD